jgi:ABC-type sugar transport system ATPase subunit
MAYVEFQNITKSFGESHALKDVSFTVADGSFLVIVGPSGCGKSTLLRLLSGLEAPDSGRIMVDGVDVSNKPPKDRGCAMVFQSYALYPHWTVFENIAFPLKIRRIAREEIRRRVEAIAESLQLSRHLAKRPKSLSGGERQRVALGRAIAADPQIFLFDEPLSNLDAPLRAGMRREIVQRQRTLGRTALYVTHDQTEALTMGDRILVLDAGLVRGEGTPDQLYRDPPNRFVASFLGRPPINLLRGALKSGASGWRFEPAGIAIPDEIASQLPGEQMTDCELGLRPEHCKPGPPNPDGAWRIREREFLGDRVYYTLDSAAGTVVATADAMVSQSDALPLDAQVTLNADSQHALFFDPKNGRRLV